MLRLNKEAFLEEKILNLEERLDEANKSWMILLPPYQGVHPQDAAARQLAPYQGAHPQESAARQPAPQEGHPQEPAPEGARGGVGFGGAARGAAHGDAGIDRGRGGRLPEWAQDGLTRPLRRPKTAS